MAIWYMSIVSCRDKHVHCWQQHPQLSACDGLYTCRFGVVDTEVSRVQHDSSDKTLNQARREHRLCT